MAKSVDARLHKLQRTVSRQRGRERVLIVDGRGKTQEEIDQEIARLKAAGHDPEIFLINDEVDGPFSKRDQGGERWPVTPA